MSSSRVLRLVLLFACVLAAGAAHAAVSCAEPYQVGHRLLRVGKTAVALWYPTVTPGRAHRYADGLVGDVAPGAVPLTGCGPFPLVVFSHGLGGCGIQSVFFTESLARRGYVVAAPDHADALFCTSDGSRPAKPQSAPPPLLDPGTWTAASYADRRFDVTAVLDTLLGERPWNALVAADRIGIAGHSLGGYTALAMTGAWPAWHDPRLRAALLFSPYALPLSLRGDLRAVRVPVMYQGADLDFFVTPFVEGPQGAYAVAHAPKYYAKLRAGHHFIWTNLLCAGIATVARCMAARPEAGLIVSYGVAFLDQYLKGRPQALLSSSASGLSGFAREP